MVHRNGHGPPLSTAFRVPRSLRSPTARCIALPITRFIFRSGAPSAMAPYASCIQRVREPERAFLRRCSSQTRQGLNNVLVEVKPM